MKDKQKQDEGGVEPAETQEPTVSGPELKTSENDERVARELAALARESVNRDLDVARLEAEVMALRERFAPQPISTCPKDWTTFLAWYPETRIPMWAITCHDGTSLCGNALDDSGHEATHWVPLPKPPVTEGRE